MTARRLRAAPTVPATLLDGFAAIRRELEIPTAFPDDVLAEADRVARGGFAVAGRTDMRATEFVTIDPAGSRDLDQALCIDRDGDGFVVRYAIADLDAWVPPGGAIEAEAWRRGSTLYSPDTRTPLYPPSLSEGAASLLPDGDRPAVVFTVPVAADGTAAPGATLTRAVVRSRRQMAYGEAEVPNLREAGTLLAAAGERRGAREIDLPGQEVVPADTPQGFALALEQRIPQEDWNAQISLIANMTAAAVMLRAGVGLFRVLGPPDPERVAGLQAAAAALGATLHSHVAPPAGPPPAATHQLRRTARAASHGAGYVALPAPEPPWHSAVAAPYAHATAPLRRLGDRYVLRLATLLCTGGTVDDALRADITRLPEVMNRSEALADRLENACIDLVEATVLTGREGETFQAVVTGTHQNAARIQLVDPPVRGSLPDAAGLAPGDRVEVVLREADPARRAVAFTRR
ncbi:MAG: RNB domain-containing ribonuclease [Thermoleophilia bacterium]